MKRRGIYLVIREIATDKLSISRVINGYTPPPKNTTPITHFLFGDTL